MKKITYWIITIFVCLATLSIASILPHDPYLRYKSLTVGHYSKAKWIYERAVYDDTPIDIAFIGTSHTLNAVDSVKIENNIIKKTGSLKHVVNFAIPHLGRDMHKLITKLLIEKKLPEVILIEIRESEGRDQHPATHYLADGIDLLTAPLLVNQRYTGNLIRLPLRQSNLFLKTTFPEFFHADTTFNVNAYKGAHFNFTTHYPSGKSRDKEHTKFVLDELYAQRSQKHSYKLARDNELMNFINFNANWVNLRGAVELAKAKGVKVYFTYLPSYNSGSQPIDALIYEEMAPILYIKNAQTLGNPKHWYDFGHLNGVGAMAYSEEISALLIEELSLLKL